MKKKFNHLIFIALLAFGCSNEPIILQPQSATLLSPENNETCLDGNSLNDTQSSVAFSWTMAENTVSYEVIINNLSTQSVQNITVNQNQTLITLNKEEPYSWKVRSIGQEGSTPSESLTWKFYLAGDAITNFAPFPSELLRPRSGANVTPGINNLVTFNWACNDVDNDLNLYKFYLDNTDATSLHTEIIYIEDNTSIEVQLENNKTYYWKVIAVDSNNNTSDSGVYAFKTN